MFAVTTIFTIVITKNTIITTVLTNITIVITTKKESYNIKIYNHHL